MWILGIDFGTSYTYVYGFKYEKNISDGGKLYDLLTNSKLRGKLKVMSPRRALYGIPTAIGYDMDSKEWCIGERPLQNKTRYRYYDRLKYDIRHFAEEMLDEIYEFKISTDEYEQIENKTRRDLIRDFFKILAEHLANADGEFKVEKGNENIARIVVGEPVQDADVYEKILCEIIAEAFDIDDSRVSCEYEPVLAGYAYNKTDPNFLKGNMLVVDVGGGTTDFSFLDVEERGEGNISIKDFNKVTAKQVYSYGTDVAGQQFKEILSEKIKNVFSTEDGIEGIELEDNELTLLSLNPEEYWTEIDPAEEKPAPRYTVADLKLPTNVDRKRFENRTYLFFSQEDLDVALRGSRELLRKINNREADGHLIIYNDDSYLIKDETGVIKSFEFYVKTISDDLKGYLESDAINQENLKNMTGILFVGGTTRFYDLRLSIINTVKELLVSKGIDPNLSQIIFPDGREMDLDKLLKKDSHQVIKGEYSSKEKITCSNAIALGACVKGICAGELLNAKERDITLYVSNRVPKIKDVKILSQIFRGNETCKLFNEAEREIPTDGLTTKEPYTEGHKTLIAYVRQEIDINKKDKCIYCLRVSDNNKSCIKFELDLCDENKKCRFKGDLLITARQNFKGTKIECYDSRRDGTLVLIAEFNIGTIG